MTVCHYRRGAPGGTRSSTASSVRSPITGQGSRCDPWRSCCGLHTRDHDEDGLTVKAVLDEGIYPKGQKVSWKDVDDLNLTPHQVCSGMELYDPSVALTAQDEVDLRPANIHLEDIPQSREKLHAATGELAPTGPKKWYPSWPIPTLNGCPDRLSRYLQQSGPYPESSRGSLGSPGSDHGRDRRAGERWEVEFLRTATFEVEVSAPRPASWEEKSVATPVRPVQRLTGLLASDRERHDHRLSRVGVVHYIKLRSDPVTTARNDAGRREIQVAISDECPQLTRIPSSKHGRAVVETRPVYLTTALSMRERTSALSGFGVSVNASSRSRWTNTIVRPNTPTEKRVPVMTCDWIWWRYDQGML